jgi:hypothetical protein
MFLMTWKKLWEYLWVWILELTLADNEETAETMLIQHNF